MPADTQFVQERQELDALLASGIFARAPGLAQLLTYVCGRYFEGEAEQIKEYNIAVDALGRPPEFNQKKDSIVRVEAHRLRKRLREYYERDGADRPLQIIIPEGRYAPFFIPRPQPAPDVSVAVTQAVSLSPHNPQIVTAPPDIYMVRAGSRWSTAWLPLAALVAVLAGLGILVSVRSRSTQTRVVEATTTGYPAAGMGREIRLAAGSSSAYNDRFGQTWAADRWFTGGDTYHSVEHPIFGTSDPSIYQNRREGTFRYDIPLAPGIYELRLHFAETLYGEMNLAGGGETSRIFHVIANGKTILQNMDVVADAGPSTADVRVFEDISPASDGLLHLQFQSMKDVAFVNGIEITPGVAGRMLPIRILAQEHPFTDRNGVVWQPDHFFKGGQHVDRLQAVSGTSDPELFRGERFGNFSYSIPVAPGRYAVTLKFAEMWFGPTKPSHGGPNSRMFDIFCNGVALARNVDVYKEAGGSDRVLGKTWHGLEPNAQGKLALSFVPVRNYAFINGIEIVPESK
jgi:Malectin domain